MANNRLLLKCIICGEEKVIAKYYPSTGWCFFCLPKNPPKVTVNSPEDITLEHFEKLGDFSCEDAFQTWMKEHSHGNFSMYGATHFELKYETKNLCDWAGVVETMKYCPVFYKEKGKWKKIEK